MKGKLIRPAFVALATIPVQAVITLTSPGTISLQCEDANQAGAEAFNWQLAAIKIGTVHS